LPESTSATAAHNAAQDVLALLKDYYHITDVDIDFRESFYTRQVGPQLRKTVQEADPIVDFVSPFTPALGLRISTRIRPEAQGTMALYLAEGGGSDRLMGLSCRHVLIGSEEQDNVDYVYGPGMRRKDVLLLGERYLTNLVDLIKQRIDQCDFLVKDYTISIGALKEKEKDTDAVDTEKAEAARIKVQGLLDRAKKDKEALNVLLNQVNRDWKKLDNRVLGYILRSPAIGLGVSEHRFTEDWGIFHVNRTKLGDGFQGNKMDLGAI